MNLILLKEKDFIDDQRVVLKGRRARHILDIIKADIGQELVVGELDGNMGSGTVIAKGGHKVELSVALEKKPPQPLALTLVLALPRPIVLKRLFVTMGSLGIKKIILLHSRRVEKSYWHSPVLAQDTISKQLILGLEQSKDTLLPDVQLKKKFKPFIEDELPLLLKGATPIIAHPQDCRQIPASSDKPVVLVIGPEGGFIPWELEQFWQLGFYPLSLGKRILKVEAAVCAAVAKLCL